MSKLNKLKSLNQLKARQDAIIYESEEDEGAQEHYGEIQSIIDVLSKNNSDDNEIIKAAEWVGLESDLVFA